jgi:hypothetical protein
LPKAKPIPLGNEPDEIRATAQLPGLGIEIRHRRSPDGDAEQIMIHLQATPSFDAVGSWLKLANPFLFWAEATRLTWESWSRAMLPARDAPPALPRPDDETRR